VVTFQRITRKYPEVDRRGVLADLADWSGEPGKWFAAAKNDGYLDMALEFAEIGRTEPRTLSRASRDFLKSQPLFAFRVGRLAVERILAGDGYEITALDLLGAGDRFLAAASTVSMTSCRTSARRTRRRRRARSSGSPTSPPRCASWWTSSPKW